MGRRAPRLAAALLLAGPLLAGAARPVAQARGAALFADPGLGTNGKTCASCHRGGQRLDPEELAEASDAGLGAYANSCITAMLKGRPLPEGSADLGALVSHLRTFQSKGRPAQ